jgi:hypothetical protein
MNAITQIEPPPPRAVDLVPANMGEAMKLAEMMASARLVPKDLQKSPADCLLVVMQAVRWQMDAFAVAQECSVIQGKLMHSGKLVAAVVNARGNLTQRLSFKYAGDGEHRNICVSGQLRGETEPREVVVWIKDAKTANRVWQTQPDQQLMYHGTRVWARRHTPELMLGVYSPEEFDEPQQARRPEPPKVTPTLPERKPDEQMETLRQQSADLSEKIADVAPIKPFEFRPNGDDAESWREWANNLLEQVRAAPDADTINNWTTENFTHLTRLQKASERLSKYVVDGINAEIAKRLGEGT